MDDVVRIAVDAARRQDWAELKRVLHPYVHWCAAGTTLRGRIKVLTHLETAPPPDPPTSYELRDGQIYRWHGP